ncbi:active regulator of SIRT1 [Amia ocellicauda]|uniref:active regulator of SIRT1 n=1 Tax=Amia ocellicauda TaxID=2972642 RepID=UPI003463FB78|nr:AROS regulator [Amia calva]
MSASLMRKGLELLSDDLKDTERRGKKKRESGEKAGGAGSVKDCIGTNRQGVSKQRWRLQGQSGKGRAQGTVKNKRVISAVEEFRRQQSPSQMNTNLQYFLGTGFKTEQAVTEKILTQQRGRQSRDVPQRREQPRAKEPRSVFTEEEFQQFQKEYFGRTVEGVQ